MAFKDIKDQQEIIKEKVVTSKDSPREPRYWAFCANPKRYKVREAVYRLKTSYWFVDRSAVREGDFAVIWQSLDDRGKRGVVAFAEILSNPREKENFDDPYWVKQDELQQKRNRVLVNVYLSPGLPLWVDKSHVGDFLRTLSVARARGRTVFHLSSEQWEKLLELAGLRESPPFYSGKFVTRPR